MVERTEITSAAELISEALQLDPVVEDTRYLFHFDEFPEPLILDFDELDIILNKLSEMTEAEDTALFDGTCYEVLIRSETGLRFPYLRRFSEEGFSFRDDDNEITYSLARPSDEYMIFLLRKLVAIAPLKLAFRPPPSYRLRRIVDNAENIDLDPLGVLKQSLPRLLTLRISSDRDRSLVEFIRFSNSFVFQFSYNLDLALVPERYFDDLVRTSRIRGHRRGKLDEIDPPRRTYIPDLIYHYQLAVASDSPPLEYLSFYHVAEHFFEAVFEEDLINRLRNVRTQPDFSYRRKRDIKKLIGEVSGSLKFRAEDVVFNEEEALRLTIHKYVEIAQLIQHLQEYDPKLLQYYRKNDVRFSRGNKLDLESDDADEIIKLLSRRIYRTRNAIVHSKEGERGKYIPFEHDRILVREVPLLRFIAEIIILESSNLIA